MARGVGYPWVGLGLALAYPHSAFSLSPTGVSTGNVCPLMLFPTAASARMGTRGPCATRPGYLQTRVWACSACMATARPWPPRGHTVCVILAFRASYVSKVRERPPDMPSPGPLPTVGSSNLFISSSQPQQPLCAPALLLHLRLLSGFSAPHSLGSESHPQIGPPFIPGLPFPAAPYGGKCPCWLGSPYKRDHLGNSSCSNLCMLAHHLRTREQQEV